MPSRSVRRRKHKQAVRVQELSDSQKRVIGIWHLKQWRTEAYRRANDLGEAAAWALEAEMRPQALALDPSGELAAELSRTCAEAVSQASGSDLLSRGRRRADRARIDTRR